MALISQRITQLLYVGLSNLSLVELPADAKLALKLIRHANPGGTGYVSFDPSVTVNSLKIAVAPTPLKISQYIIEKYPGYDPFELPGFEPVIEGGGTPMAPNTLTPTARLIDPLVTVIQPVVQTSRVVLSGGAFIVGSGTLETRINSGPYGTLAAANAAIAALPDSLFLPTGPGYQLQFRITRTTTLAPATAAVLVTY